MSGYYPEEIIEEVRVNNDIVEVISEYVRLKRGGRNYFGLCPFHGEKTPSFSVSQDKQIYHCFGCNAGGNVIGFVMKIENIGFTEAVQMLAKRARIELPEENVSEEVRQKNLLKEQIYKVNTEAARYYYQCLMSEGGKAARDYFSKRGIDLKTIKKFGLGYAPNEWDSLNKYLLGKGFSQDIIYKAALAKKTKQSSYIDMFRDRVMFPIFDTSSKIIAFGGRTMTDALPKYLNSPETMVFNKSRNLYALNISKNSDTKRLIIVEGYMDVIALQQFGVDYAVASLGTALTSNQAKLLKKYAEEIIVAYDSDNAGQNAALRGIEILTEAGCNLKVLQLPEGKDPDEYVRKNGIDKFIYLINNAKSFVKFKFDLLREKHNIENVEGKINFLNAASVILAKIDNTIERDAYIRDLEKETGISSDSIIAQINKKLYKEDKPKKNFKNTVETKTVDVTIDKKLDNAEKMLIFIISQYEEIYKKYKELINEELFTYEVNKKIASIVLERLTTKQSVEPGEIMVYLKEDDEIRTVSQIFSLNIEYEDINQAVEQCLKYINDIKKKAKITQLMNIAEGDTEKLKELNELVKNNNLAREKERR